MREPHSGTGECVDVRRAYVRRSITGKIAIAEIVGEYDEDVRRCRRLRSGDQGCGKELAAVHPTTIREPQYISFIPNWIIRGKLPWALTTPNCGFPKF